LLFAVNVNYIRSFDISIVRFQFTGQTRDNRRTNSIA